MSFADKKVVLPSGCEHDARIEMRRRAFKFLVTEALEQIASLDIQRRDLAAERSIRRTRLMILKGQRGGLEAMLDGGGGVTEKIAEAERNLSENERALAALPSTGKTLEYIIERLKDVLTHGSDYIRIEMVKLRLDQMNVVVPEGSGEAPVEIVLPKVLVKRAPVVNLLACSFPRDEFVRRGSLLNEAQRLLG